MKDFELGEKVEFEKGRSNFRRTRYEGRGIGGATNWSDNGSTGKWVQRTVTYADSNKFYADDTDWPQPSKCPGLYEIPGCIRRINDEPVVTEFNPMDRFSNLELKE